MSIKKSGAATRSMTAVFLAGLACSSWAVAATTTYISQSAQGAADGSSCANARPASWFNNGANWGSASGQIGPGATVQLCGIISTNLTFQRSGASGAYVTVDGRGATYRATFFSNNQSWWRVQNVTWDSSGPTMMSIVGGSNGVFTGNYSDNVSGQPAVWIGQGNTLPNNMTISNNFIRTASTDFGNAQHDIIATEGSTNVVIEGNYLEMRAGGAGSEAHDDVIQTWESGSSSSKGNPSNWTIRYNRIVMNSAATNDRSWTMLESLSGTINIYGNVFLGLQGAGSANGLNAHNNASSVIFNIYNNTFVAKSGASNNTISMQDGGTAYLRNNIVHTVNQTALNGNMAKVLDHNLWYGTNIPSCSSDTGGVCRQDPLFVDYANNDFSLQPGSPANNTASNLGTPYASGIAPGSSWPNPSLAQRPASGNWDRGAYELDAGSTVPSVPAPSNLRVM